MSADGIDYELTRARLRDGRETTVYLVRYPRASTAVRVICFAEPRRLDVWCAANGHPEAVVAGFFVRDPFRPLGEAWVGGEAVPHEPVEAPWGPRRAVVHIDGDVRLAARGDIPDEPSGDLVTAGPLLVRSGRSLIGGEDREGFSAERGSSTRTLRRAPPALRARAESNRAAGGGVRRPPHRRGRGA